MSQYPEWHANAPEWHPIKSGDKVPKDAVCGGKTKTDTHDTFVARNSDGEVGKLTTSSDRHMSNIWCNHGGKAEAGEILVTNGAIFNWIKVKKGEDLPAGALQGGETSTDGPVFVAKVQGVGIGKLNTHNRERKKAENFWTHEGGLIKHGCYHECEVLCLAPSRWQPIRQGDHIPPGAIEAGHTSTDGSVFVAKGKDGELGKLNLDKEHKMHHIWSHQRGCTDHGEILLLSAGVHYEWKKAKKGQAIPEGALLGGTFDTDGDIYPCRNDEGACGKMNVSHNKVNHFWFHGDWFHKEKGEVLCVDPLPLAVAEGKGCAKGKGKGKHGKGYRPKPDAPHAPREINHSHFNPHAMCDGITAGERVKWLMENQGKSEIEAKAIVMSEFPHVFSDDWMPDALCDGIRAQERAQWLVDHEGLNMHAARERVKAEFPAVFDWWKPDADCDGSTAQARAQWLIENKGLSLEAAKQQIRLEFPEVFGHHKHGI